MQADDPVSFLQLTSKNDLGTTEVSRSLDIILLYEPGKIIRV